MTPPSQRAALVAAQLMAQPRTVVQLLEAIGLRKNHRELVTRYVREFHDLGCVYVKAWERPPLSNRYVPVYAWQPSLFANEDAVRPSHFV